ncbi:MAG TPA: aminoacetone oxidase family FAD-binding enzyme [Candidatus Polarisedimenticolia bacterium]|jgi:hypothetical protein
METVDLVVVGAGAAGLMAGIQAGRAHRGARIVVLDSARKIGAKILVSGGGRCNVTHDQVDETSFWGSSRPAIRKVLRRFDVPHTIEFFRELGVPLKTEETGKLFPVTDRARTVLDALLAAARAAGVDLRHPCRAESLRREDGAFVIAGPPTGAGVWGPLRAARVILATGGMSLPKSGSDGRGYELARGLGHSVTPRIFPGLVPLTLERGSFPLSLSGLSALATLEVRSATGRSIISFTGAVLCTHFGLSGPAVLDISRHYLQARHADPGAALVANWLPGESAESIDAMLRGLGARGPGRALRERMPERLARALCLAAGVDPSEPGHGLTREKRRALAERIGGMVLPVTGTRGFDVAEVTAGGVPLDELRLDTMASRVCPGLSLCGEICDVDGRIGGYNFQWAWASGHVAGLSAIA